MNTQNTYNGYTNYATWLVALHIDNDEYFQEESLQLHDEDTYDYSKALEEWFDDIVESLNGFNNPLICDLIRGTLSDVNWYELAEMYQQTYKEVNCEED